MAFFPTSVLDQAVLNEQLKSLFAPATASGSIATFSNGGNGIPVSEFECEIVAQQASGTPTPDNPLAITGFSQADIIDCGLNIFDEEMEVGTLNNSTGETETDANKMRSVNFIPVKPNTTYGVYNNTGVNLYIYSYGVDKTFKGFDNTGMVTGSTFTTDSNTHYIKFRTQNNPSYSNNISINYPSTDTQYHAYTGNLYTVSFGQTIYGGRLIYANGQWSIEATHGIKLINDLPLSYVSSNDFFYVQLPEKAKNDNYLCECLNNIGLKNDTQMATANNYSIAYAGAEVKIKYTDTTDVSVLKTAIGSYKFVYELATPVIIPITSSTRVKTISGDNNIYSNTGDCELKYFTDKADSLAELIKAFVL